MAPPSGSGSAVSDSAATPTSPMLDRTASAATPTAPMTDRVAPEAGSAGGATVPAQDRAAPTGGGSGGGNTHVLTTSKNSGSNKSNNGGSSSSSSGNLHKLQVALDQLHDAIIKVNGHRARIADLLAQIQTEFTAAHDAWQSPSAMTFEATAQWFTDSSRALKGLLDEMATRMQGTYDTYHAAEIANAHNSGG